jgi:hypothetical protein
MRYTQKVSIWPVGFVGRLLYERPICINGLVVDWFFYFNKKRIFPTDMASFAINTRLLINKKSALFPYVSKKNYESIFLTQLIKIEDLEGKANDCTKVILLFL